MNKQPPVFVKTTVLHFCRLALHEDCPEVVTTIQGNKVVCLCQCHRNQPKGV